MLRVWHGTVAWLELSAAPLFARLARAIGRQNRRLEQEASSTAPAAAVVRALILSHTIVLIVYSTPMQLARHLFISLPTTLPFLDYVAAGRTVQRL